MFEAKILKGARGFKLLFSGINCCVSPGELLHIKGPNGVGKTTLLKIFAGLMQPKEGAICWNQVETHQQRELFLSELLYVGDKPALHEELTAAENVHFFMKIAMHSSPYRLNEVLDKLGLTKCKHLPVKYLSTGQKKRTALARLLVEKKPLWILDEPFNALDQRGIETVVTLVEDHLEKAGLVILTSHLSIPVSSQKLKILELKGTASC